MTSWKTATKQPTKKNPTKTNNKQNNTQNQNKPKPHHQALHGFVIPPSKAYKRSQGEEKLREVRKSELRREERKHRPRAWFINTKATTSTPSILFFEHVSHWTEKWYYLFVWLFLICASLLLGWKQDATVNSRNLFWHNKGYGSRLKDTDKKKGHIFTKFLLSPKWVCFFPMFLSKILPSCFATPKMCHSILTHYFCSAVTYSELIFFHWTYSVSLFVQLVTHWRYYTDVTTCR